MCYGLFLQFSTHVGSPFDSTPTQVSPKKASSVTLRVKKGRRAEQECRINVWVNVQDPTLFDPPFLKLATFLFSYYIFYDCRRHAGAWDALFIHCNATFSQS
jgi:hypothetical protein